METFFLFIPLVVLIKQNQTKLLRTQINPRTNILSENNSGFLRPVALLEVKDREETRERRSIIPSVNPLLLAAELIAKIGRKKNMLLVMQSAAVVVVVVAVVVGGGDGCGGVGGAQKWQE